MRKKINFREYLPVNARVLRVDVNGAGIHIHVNPAKMDIMSITFPVRPDVAADLCRILEVDHLSMIDKGPPIYIRALGFVEWDDNGMKGLAHLIEDFGISAFDYYVDGTPAGGLLEPKKNEMPPHGEEEIFYMSTIEPPPGLPWKMHPDPDVSDGYQLVDESGNTVALVKEPLASWIAKKAQLATFEE